MISVYFQGKTFNITVIQVYAPTADAKEAEVDQFYEDLQNFLQLTHTHTHKDVLFIIRDWNAKVGSQEISRVIGKFVLEVQNEAGQRLTEFLSREHSGHNKHSFPQPKRRFYTLTSPES